MGIDELTSDKPDDDIEPHIQLTFPNPEHPDVGELIYDNENATTYYEDVKWLKDMMESDASAMVGTFVHAVRVAEEEDDCSELAEILAAFVMAGDDKDDK